MIRMYLTLTDPAATARPGHFICGCLKAGDVVALDGPLGAGKSVLARSIIRQVCPHEGDIPSPTFTLVQTYEAANGPSLMHFDLYRLESPEEALELGIEDAFVDAVCLIEWARRLGPWLPRTALRVTLEPVADEPAARTVTISGGAEWRTLLETVNAGMKMTS